MKTLKIAYFVYCAIVIIFSTATTLGSEVNFYDIISLCMINTILLIGYVTLAAEIVRDDIIATIRKDKNNEKQHG